MMASLQQPSAPAPTGSAPRAGGPALLFGVGLLLTAGLVGAVVVLVTWPPVPLPLLIVCAALGLSLGPWGPVALVAGVVLRRNRRILATGSVAVGTVTAVAPTASRLNGRPVFRVRLSVPVPGEQPVETSIRCVPPPTLVERLEPGAELPVRVGQGSRRARIDWAAVSEQAPRRPAAAGTVAAGGMPGTGRPLRPLAAGLVVAGAGLAVLAGAGLAATGFLGVSRAMPEPISVFAPDEERTVSLDDSGPWVITAGSPGRRGIEGSSCTVTAADGREIALDPPTYELQSDRNSYRWYRVTTFTVAAPGPHTLDCTAAGDVDRFGVGRPADLPRFVAWLGAVLAGLGLAVTALTVTVVGRRRTRRDGRR
ncbi:MAG: hypothetical protein GXX79_21130 [Actinomycetales bacterium]|nr:hypothetical protein [Actinomycetales bacterium]